MQAMNIPHMSTNVHNRIRDPELLEEAESMFWPKGLDPGGLDFPLNMVRMQIYLIQHYLRVMPAESVPRAHRRLDALHLERRSMERILEHRRY